MQLTQVLGVIQGLLLAAEHPDIVSVERYGTATEPWGPKTQQQTNISTAGVKVTYTATSTAMLWGALASDTVVVPMPAEMPPPILRGPRLSIFVAQLLDVARPQLFTSWQLVSRPTVGPKDRLGVLPYGIAIDCADRTKTLLMAQATGAMVGAEPETDPFPDYVIPESLRSWQPEAAARG